MTISALVFYIFLLTAVILLLFGFKKNIVFAILLINLAADLTAGYYTEEQIHSGLIRGFVVTILLSIGLIKYVKLNRITLAIGLFMLYLFVIIALFSTNQIYSYSHYLKWYTSVFLLPLSYFTFSTKSVRNMCMFSVIALFIIMVNFIFSQYYGLGPTHYDSDIHTGGTDVQISFTISTVLLIFPLILKISENKSTKFFLLALYSSSFISMLLLGRRGAVLAYGVGLVIFLFYSNEKIKTIFPTIFLFLVFLLTLPLFEDQLDKIVQHRSKDVENIQEYGRFNEFKQYPEQVLQNGNLLHVLFGQEMFNYHTVLKSTRGIHTIYTTFLYGSGLVGIVLYIYILLKVFVRFVKTNSNYEPIVLVKAVSISLLVANLIIDFSGSGLLYRSFLYAFLGLFLRYVVINSYKFENQEINKPIGFTDR